MSYTTNIEKYEKIICKRGMQFPLEELSLMSIGYPHWHYIPSIMSFYYLRSCESGKI